MLHSARGPGQNRCGWSGRLLARLQAGVFAGLYRWGSRWYERVGHAAFGDDWDSWRAAVVPLVDDEPVLDLGCGAGTLLAALRQKGVQAVGVDRSGAMLARSRRDVDGRTLPLARADAAALPFGNGSFGAVVSTFPASFILDPRVTAEIARVLRPGGIVAVVVGGRIERWRWWHIPRRAALRLFYGSASPEPPGVDLLVDHRLTGTWIEVHSPNGRAWIWVARRT